MREPQYDERGYEQMSDTEYLMIVEAIRLATPERIEFDRAED